jgi:hypothetical protein
MADCDVCCSEQWNSTRRLSDGTALAGRNQRRVGSCWPTCQPLCRPAAAPLSGCPFFARTRATALGELQRSPKNSTGGSRWAAGPAPCWSADPDGRLGLLAGHPPPFSGSLWLAGGDKPWACRPRHPPSGSSCLFGIVPRVPCRIRGRTACGGVSLSLPL